jgi:hypothetical protein
MTVTATATIDKLYEEACLKVSDINEHLPVLRELAVGKRVLELGVRTGESTRAFLAARPELLVSVDCNWGNLAPQVIEVATEAGIPWIRLHQDSRALVPVESFDLLFVDTLHTESHVREELAAHAHKAQRIAFHDSVTNWTHGEQGQPGIGAPIMDLCATGQFRLEASYGNNNGLLVLCRRAA